MSLVPSIGGVILCGGQSTRMGRPKASLPFGPELMLQRVVRILRQVVSPIVVVAAQGQDVPELPPEIEIARDEHEELGPLAGIAVGLGALRTRVTAAYVSSCDVPLLRPEFILQVIELLGDYELAIPRDGQFYHPLAAVYRTALEVEVRTLLAANRLRPAFLMEHVRTREIDIDELRRSDPRLDSLRNTNTPTDYDAALRDAGLAPLI